MLCNHPSPTFSNKFLSDNPFYDPEANCTFDKGFMTSFTDITDFCLYLYGLIYDVNLFSMTILGEIPKRLFYNKAFESMCVPFYELKQECESKGLFKACNDDTVIFLDSDACPRPPSTFTDFEYYLANYIETDDLHCLAKICDGTYHTLESDVNGVKFKLSNYHLLYENRTCDVFPFVASFANRTVLFAYVNIYWPCCFPLYIVHWAEQPEERGLNGVWSFLPFSCRVGEICLIMLVACVAVGGVVGNLMVMMVMLRISNRDEESSMLRLSLAVADFLTCAFVVLPSLYEHVKPLLTPTEPIHTFHTPEVLPPSREVDRTSMVFPFRFFQGLVFASCSIVSLLTLFLLSAERFVMTGRGLMYKHYITPPRVRQAMVISWVISWVNASLMTIFGREIPSVAWLNFVKIPVGLSSYAQDDLVAYASFLIQIFLLSLSVPSTAILSVLSIKNFVQEQNRVRERWDQLQMRVSGPFESENRYIFVTQLLMTVFFLISVIPLSIYFLDFNLLQIQYYSYSSMASLSPLFQYISWWLFLASTAWNPWIYNMRSHNFRTELRKMARMCVPAVLRDMWRPRPTQETRDVLTRKQKLLSRVGIST